MSKYLKAIAGVVGFAMVLTLVAGTVAPVKAATIDELNAMIATLTAQLAALQGGSATPAPAAYTYTRDLTIGASGADVTALQNFLISKGFSIPAGATGYFGTQSKTALAAYQAANGIVPASGYFGPITRAKVNAVVVVPPVTPGTPGTPSTDEGTEGQLNNFDELSADSTVQEGDSNVEVLGLGFDAKDSDMTISRVDVDMTKSGGTSGASTRLNRYFDSVSLTLDGKKIATLDASDADKNGSVYSFRFSGLNSVVSKGETGELYVTVNAVDNVDGTDEGAEWTVKIPAGGIRAVDTAGISDTYDSELHDEVVTVGAISGVELKASADSSNPEDQTVRVSKDSDTNGVTALVFKLKAEGDDLTVNQIPVILATTSGATSTVGHIAKKIYLYQGNTELDHITVPSSATSSTVLTFGSDDDLGIDIDKDATKVFTVKIDVNDLDDATFAEGDAMTVSLDNVDLIQAENSMGDAVGTSDLSGSANGNDMTFYETGISITKVSTDQEESFTADSTGEADEGTYTIVFRVSSEDDVYVSATSTEVSTGTATAAQGVAYAITNYGSNTTTSSFEAEGTESNDSTNPNVFFVPGGESRDFTLTVFATATSSATARVSLKSIAWGTDADTVTNLYTTGLSDIKTTDLNLSVR